MKVLNSILRLNGTFHAKIKSNPMSKQTLKIDLKPVTPREKFTSYYIKFYMLDECITGIIPLDQVKRMVEAGIVHQTFGTREVNGKMERFEYEDKLDGAGVQYTSALYEIEEKVF
jgi:hypothetical protein